jgi:hypothetical protein
MHESLGEAMRGYAGCGAVRGYADLGGTKDE